MQLIDEQDCKMKIRGYIESKRWWTIFPLERGDWLTLIEETFYAGEANGDLHLLMGSYLPGFCVAFALKDHMTGQQLLDLGVLNLQSVEDIGERDIFWFCTIGKEAEGATAAAYFLAWMYEAIAKAEGE